MDTMGKRLKYLMDEYWTLKTGERITQTALALEIDASQGAIGKVREDNLKETALTVRLSKFFKCDPFWLELGEGTPFPKQENSIPIVPWHLISNYTKEIGSNEIPPSNLLETYKNLNIEPLDLTFKKYSNVFCSKIPKGIEPGMTSYFKPGQTLIIKPKNTASLNDFVIVYHIDKPEDPRYMRYFVNINGKELFYEATPDKQTPVDKTEELIICGVIIADFNLYI